MGPAIRLQARARGHALTAMVAVLLLSGIFPAPGPEAVAATGAPGGMNVRAYVCPPGSDIPGYDVAGCTASPLGNVTFQLITATGEMRPPATTYTEGSSGVIGWTSWIGVPAGSSYVWTTLPDGFVHVRVFCGPHYGVPAEYVEHLVDGELGIQFQMPPDYPYQCNWYFLQATPVDADPTPDDGGGTGEGDQTGSGDDATGNEAGSQEDALTLHVFGCPPEFTTDTPMEDLVDDCQPAQQELFLLDGVDDSNQLPDEQGMIRWENLATGPVTPIHVKFSEDFTPLRVFCATYPTGATPGEYVDQLVNTESNPRIDLQMQAGQSVDCVWYIVPLVTQIGVRTFICTSAFDSAGSVAEQIDDEQRCRPGPDAQIATYDTPGREIRVRIVGGDGWTGISTARPGETRISLPPLEGYPGLHVRCNVRPWTLLHPENHEETELDDGRAIFDLRAGEEVECLWINIAQDEDLLPGVANGETYTLTVLAYVCADGRAAPPEMDLAMAAAWREECDPREGVAFYVEMSGGSGVYSGDHYEETRITDETGQAVWSNLPADYLPPSYQDGNMPPTLAVGTVADDGFFTTVVYCESGSVRYGRSSSGSVTRMNLPAINFTSGSVMCHWFASPVVNDAATPDDAEYGRVIIHKHMCGPDVQPGAAYQEIQERCFNSLSGAGFPFTVELDSYSASVSTDDTGTASWDQVPAGAVTITEDVLEGYRIVGVYCQTYADDIVLFGDFYAAVDLAELPSITEELSAGYVLECAWVNGPVDNGELVVVTALKYLCAPGVDLVSEPQEVTQSCRREYNQPLVLVDAAGIEISVETGLDGRARWQDVAPGEFMISEPPSPNYQPILVRCDAFPADSSPSNYESPEISDNRVSYQVAAGEVAHCIWYNVWIGAPEEYEVGYGRAGVFKYVCSAEFDYASASYDELSMQCEESQSGVPYTFEMADGTMGESATAPNGIVDSGPAPNGSIRIIELEPPGYRTARVFCKTGLSGNPLPAMEEVMTESGDGQTAISHTMRAGYFLQCDWFNAPFGVGENGIHTLTPTYTAPANGEFVEGQDAAATYTVEAPDVTPSYTYTPEFTPTYTPEYTPTYSATPEYTATSQVPPDSTPTSTPTLVDGAPPPPTATYTATLTQGELAGSTATPTATPMAAIVIVKHNCPAGYEPATEDAKPAEDCDEEVEAVSFRLLQHDDEIDSATTEDEDDEHRVRFDELRAGIYQLEEDPEAEVALAFIGGCISSVRTFGDYAFLPYAQVDAEGRVTVQLLDGEELTCDWYNVPPAEGRVDLALYLCPGQSPNPARCDPAEEGLDVTLIPLDVGDAIAVSSDDDGIVAVIVPAGVYQIEVDGEIACLIDSVSVDDDGNFLVEGGETVGATVYRCASG